MKTRSSVSSDKHLLNPENLELDPIEADRFKQQDSVLNKSLEDLDSFLFSLKLRYSRNAAVKAKLIESKNWISKNRLTLNVDDCKRIKSELQQFLENGNF